MAYPYTWLGMMLASGTMTATETKLTLPSRMATKVRNDLFTWMLDFHEFKFDVSGNVQLSWQTTSDFPVRASHLFNENGDRRCWPAVFSESVVHQREVQFGFLQACLATRIISSLKIEACVFTFQIVEDLKRLSKSTFLVIDSTHVADSKIRNLASQEVVDGYYVLVFSI